MQYGTVVIRTSISKAIASLQEYKNKVDVSGNVYVLLRNEYADNGDVERDCFDVIASAISLGYKYVNTIVVPTADVINSSIPDNVLYIVWLAQEANHFFNKDAIREQHIWKNVEWGHRAKNYNVNGKDPGNVWIPTKDDGKAHITEHICLTDVDVLERIYKCSKQEGLAYLLISNNESDKASLHNDVDFLYVEEANKEFNVTEYTINVENKDEQLNGSVIWGTSESMDKVADDSIDVVVTSPPYWDLKDYFKEGQIGQESYQTYLDRLYKVWKQCFFKLKNTGSLWLNINIRVKNNNVILIPKDFIEQCKEIGYHYKGILIWHKSSGIPTNNSNLKDNFEFVLIFSKSDRLRISEEIKMFADYKNRKINGGMFWNINRKAGSVGKKFIHPAIYPNALVERIVEITTNKNQVVLDPFLGSGTTLIAALKKGRNAIGYEYNEGFKELILNRINNEFGDNLPFVLCFK